MQNVTTKVTPKTLKLARQLSALTGRKLYAVIEAAIQTAHDAYKASQRQ